MAQVTLTDYEKQVLRGMMAEGYFFDDLESSFINWGVYGKRERGAQTSLHNKGVICIEGNFGEDGETCVSCGDGYTKHDIAEISGWNEILPWGERYRV